MAAKKSIEGSCALEQRWSNTKWIGEISFMVLPQSYCRVSERKIESIT